MNTSILKTIMKKAIPDVIIEEGRKICLKKQASKGDFYRKRLSKKNKKRK